MTSTKERKKWQVCLWAFPLVYTVILPQALAIARRKFLHTILSVSKRNWPQPPPSKPLTDDGVDAETSLSLSLHLYLSSPPLHFLLTLTLGH